MLTRFIMYCTWPLQVIGIHFSVACIYLLILYSTWWLFQQFQSSLIFFVFYLQPHWSFFFKLSKVGERPDCFFIILSLFLRGLKPHFKPPFNTKSLIKNNFKKELAKYSSFFSIFLRWLLVFFFWLQSPLFSLGGQPLFLFFVWFCSCLPSFSSLVWSPVVFPFSWSFPLFSIFLTQRLFSSHIVWLVGFGCLLQLVAMQVQSCRNCLQFFPLFFSPYPKL